jgi:dolichyl-phosphate-mannose-protein mannosyltransferase
MARVTSDLQSDNAAELPDWPEPGTGELGDEPQLGDGAADGGEEPEEIEGPYYVPTRRRVRRGWERGRVWYRPGGAPRPEERDSLRDRLVPPYYPEFFRGAGWILPLIVTAVGGVLRFWNLVWPNSVIFDETYYAKDGWSMYVYGWEHNWADGNTIANPALVGPGTYGHDGAAKFTCSSGCPEFVAHPPFGKWVIGAGEELWGLNPVGWRLMEAVLGTLAIYVIARAARRMFRSTLLGCVAGIFLSFDGLAFVMARTALLDGVQMFFILCAFAALLVDRDKTRARFANWREERGLTDLLGEREFGPRLGLRPWRLLAGLSLGLACATKWNAVFFVAVLAVLTVSWDIGARRAVGVRHASAVWLWTVLAIGAVAAVLCLDVKPLRILWVVLAVAAVSWVMIVTLRGQALAQLRELVWAFVSIPVLTAVTFVASYAGWFFNTANGGGYNRFWADSHPSHFWPTWTNPLRSLWNYVDQQYGFNANLQSPHPYQSNPWSWFVMGRPVAFYYEAPKTGTAGCTPSMGACSAEVLALGNPLLWWFATAAILFLFWRWIGRRDWRAAAILAGIAAGIVPWMWYAQRTIFSFYAVAFLPFMVLGATMAVGSILGRADASPTRRVWGAAVSGTVVVGVVALFAYFYPIYTGQTIPYSDWANHMWLPSWI